ncbi:hypothetical protein [Dyadobacter sp. NIV53]|uniref:hypothetical protein n=1 Tax=Dyadobacter sp. NIV53 TaxID=2861765 RepID=UPI001C87B9A5|nr:hypothetical protein [Dyadobacter sp. NIV53]
MNQTFDFHRFGLLLKLDFSEKSKNYFLTTGLFVATMLLFMLPITWSKDVSELLYLFHPLALFMIIMFGGSLLTTSVFSQYASSDTGIAALMVPASRLEKYLSALLLNLLFIVPLALLFLQIHICTIDLANSKLYGGIEKYKYIPKELLQYFFSLHVIIQGAVFLGSIYFTKLSYIKTASAVFVTAILVGGINFLFANFVTSFPSKAVAFPFSAWKIWYYESNKSYYLDYPEPVQSLVYLFPAFFLLGTWYIAYVRLKEKEI